MIEEGGIEWSRNHFRMMSDGGTWAVPRSGLVFTKQGAELVLTARLPWESGMPGDPNDLLAYQDDDYEAIKRHFEAAGIPVRKDIGGAPVVDKAEIIEHLMDPEGPDEMAFVLRSENPDPEMTFSLEGVQEIAMQVHDFLLARVGGQIGKGVSPKKMRATVKLDWVGPEDEFLDQSPRPWYALNDTGPTPFDGDVRAAAAAFAARLKKERDMGSG